MHRVGNFDRLNQPFIAVLRARRSLSSAPMQFPPPARRCAWKPGETALTRTPARPHSAASVLRYLDDAGLRRGIGMDRA